jgi:hypothetical protein
LPESYRIQLKIEKNNLNRTVSSYRSEKIIGVVSFPAINRKKSLEDFISSWKTSFIAGGLHFRLENIIYRWRISFPVGKHHLSLEDFISSWKTSFIAGGFHL